MSGHRYRDRMPVDDLGTEVPLPRPVSRVVSLVPSLTEALAETQQHAIVAATEWCTFPAQLDVPRIRGTKNPDCRAIAALAPDLVVANMEENREIDVRRLRNAGVPVWVTRTESVEGALAAMERLFEEGLGWGIPRWLVEAREVWAAPPSLGGLRAAAVIWRRPWMVVGRDTFAGDLMERLGLVHAFRDASDRYPVVDVDDLDEMGLDVVLLPDEPYAFSPTDGPEAFARTPVALINGRLLTWYGPSLVTARAALEQSIRER